MGRGAHGGGAVGRGAHGGGAMDRGAHGGGAVGRGADGGGAIGRGADGSGSQGDEPTSRSTSALANSKLFRAAMSGASTTSAEKEASAVGSTKTTTASVSVETREAFAQTLRLKTGVKFVQTDPLPSVENFKDRYEKVLKEKKDLQVKLERSEDQKFKMQRDHKREIDKLEKKYYTEAKKEAEGKIRELEERIVEERQKGQASKKDQADLIRSHKAEIKSLMEKVEKLKKDVERKDVMIDTNMVQYHSEMEHLRSEKRRYDDRIRSEVDKSQKALRRAVKAEVEVLNMRREAVARPCEQRLKEVETMCANIPQGSEFHRDWLSFRDKLRTSLDCFQTAMDDQLRQVKAGRELANLDRVPNPNLPVPPQLRVPMQMPMMRPRFMPMMSMRPGPLGAVPGGLVMDPGAFAQPRMPVHTVATVQMPMGAPLLQSVDGTSSLPSADPTTSTSDLFADKNTGHDLPASAQHVASGGGRGGGDGEPEQSRGGAMGGASGGGGGGAAGGKKKSSFERIVEKLAPVYPHYAREDFKSVLHEVRRNNRNTLSGLSLDSITEQVKAIIDFKEKGRGSSSKGATGSGGSNTKGRQNKSKTTSRHQQAPPSRRPRQQVAVADPPVMSAINYDEEDGSCIICYEDMIDFDSSRLNCGHRFHTECIRSWFKEQSTCPTCRNHSLLPEEYPFLK